VPSISSRTRAA